MRGGDAVVLAVGARGAHLCERVAGEWTAWQPIPGWRGTHGDVTVAGSQTIVVGEGGYRAGGEWRDIPDWPRGSGVAAETADLDGDGRLELIVRRGRRVAVGWGLDETGHPADGWGPWEERAGADAAKASEKGVWRILDFDSQIIAVHAALLHTGDVLFFAGSGYSVPNFKARRFRTRVWHYPSAKFSKPPTPDRPVLLRPRVPARRPAARSWRDQALRPVPRDPRRAGVPRGAPLPLGRGAHAGRARDHRGVEPEAHCRGAADRGLSRRRICSRARARRSRWRATTPPTGPS